MPSLLGNVALVAQAATTTTTVPNVQSQNPILPSGAEILWGTFSFVILLVLLWKFAFPAVTAAMKAMKTISLKPGAR